MISKKPGKFGLLGYGNLNKNNPGMKKAKLQTSAIYTFQAIFLSFTAPVFAGNTDPNEDGSRYAYGENIGWMHLHSTFAVNRDNLPNFPAQSLGVSPPDWQLGPVEYNVKTSWTPVP